jgi:hypothetical protein
MTEMRAGAPPQRQSLIDCGSGYVTDTLSAADAMHAELLRQCANLMEAVAGTPAAADLERIASLVEAYEQARWWPVEDALKEAMGGKGRRGDE